LTKLVAWKDNLQSIEKELFGDYLSAQMAGDSEKDAQLDARFATKSISEHITFS
jgi:hypothetical protein